MTIEAKDLIHVTGGAPQNLSAAARGARGGANLAPPAPFLKAVPFADVIAALRGGKATPDAAAFIRTGEHYGVFRPR
jgi:hypothetical protein